MWRSMSDIMMGAVSLLWSDLYYMYMYRPIWKLKIYWRAPCMEQDDLQFRIIWLNSIFIVGVSTVRLFVISFNNRGTLGQAPCMEQDDLHFRIIGSNYSFLCEYLLFGHFLLYFIDNLRFTGVVLCSIDCDLSLLLTQIGIVPLSDRMYD
jgi:hypothetical protein